MNNQYMHPHCYHCEKPISELQAIHTGICDECCDYCGASRGIMDHWLVKLAIKLRIIKL